MPASGRHATIDTAAPSKDAGSDVEDLDAGAKPDSGDCGIGASGEALDLSCAGLYSDFASKTIAPGVVQYAPGLQLWSDGAIKTRWIQLPAGQKIDTSNMDEWSADGETSATELTLGELDANGAGYEVPSVFECNDCHQGRIDGVMGFEAVALAAPGATGLTMADLVQQGLVTDAPDSSLVIPGDAVQSAALGWLHVNCGEACHNPGNGLGGPSGFMTRLDVATLSSVQTTEAYTTGWNQPSATYQIPNATTTYRFHACDLSESAGYYRPSVRDGINGVVFGSQMPPIDTHVVDDAGLAILAAWINEGCDGGDGG